MSNALSTLKFVQAAKPKTEAVSPVERRRAALIARIEEQIALASAQSEGREFTATRTKTITNKETGEKTKQEAVKRIRPWWWQEGSRFYVSVHYGVVALQFAKNTNAIETSNLKNVVVVLNAVKLATQHGDLDSAIEAATSKRTAKQQSKKASSK